MISNNDPSYMTVFRLNLPASGLYKIRTALGDQGNANTYITAFVCDGKENGACASSSHPFDCCTGAGTGICTGSLLLTIEKDSSTAANSFVDATGTAYTAANWEGSNSQSGSLAFVGTTAFFVFGNYNHGAGNYSPVAHIYLDQQ